jgi:2-keto-4-pentenoate hydratase/2-oxohepta-3-ene-1,7-dioic acid hydratase in catechol pathway
MKLPDTSQCPDCVTFSPAIEDKEELHIEIQFTVLQRDGGEWFAKEDVVKHIAGYTLAVTQRIRKAGDSSQAGPEHDGTIYWPPRFSS